MKPRTSVRREVSSTPHLGGEGQRGVPHLEDVDAGDQLGQAGDPVFVGDPEGGRQRGSADRGLDPSLGAPWVEENRFPPDRDLTTRAKLDHRDLGVAEQERKSEGRWVAAGEGVRRGGGGVRPGDLSLAGGRQSEDGEPRETD
jgi:hypothetical protein